MATCEVVFTDNSASLYGAAIYSIRNSHVVFMGNSKVTFSNNIGAYYSILLFGRCGHGGIIYSEVHSHISFKGNSSVWFTNNTAYCGGAIYTHYNSHISFGENSSTWFISNSARLGGAIYSKIESVKDTIYFEGNSKTVFSNNTAHSSGGAMFSYGNISFKGNSSTLFDNNVAFYDNGGSICSEHADDGGAVLTMNSISFEDNSKTIFTDSTAGDSGGVIYCSNISLKRTLNLFWEWLFGYNYYTKIQRNCNITFSNNSTVIFNKSKATVGATLYSTGKITAKENSTVLIDTLPAKWCNNTCLPLTGAPQ